MPLSEIELSIDDDDPLPDDLSTRLHEASLRIQGFQDRWDRKPIEQFVASDFRLVYLCLKWIKSQPHLLPGSLFCEWGCGFAVVSCIAAELGFDVIGIEAEEDLIANAKKTVCQFRAPVELWHGNFLPPGAQSLTENPDHPSLGHIEPCVYNSQDLDVDDFDLFFAYPWPGEGEFLEAVFERYAKPGACFLTFCGPYDLRLIRKTRGNC